MKISRLPLSKTSIMVVLMIAGILTTTLNSCITSATIAYDTYTPPSWAPPYDDVSAVHYYYFPDYDMYYDVWASQFWYNDNGTWVSSAALPPNYANVNLYDSYIVLINKKYSTPWVRHDYFVKNYPPHVYDNYQNIVVNNRIVKNIQPNHNLVPRAYNENTKRVTFMQRSTQDQQNNQGQQNQQSKQYTDDPQGNRQRPVQQQAVQRIEHQPVQGTVTESQQTQTQGSGQQQTYKQPPTQGFGQTTRQPVVQQPTQASSYHTQVKEVPMKSIRPYLPQQSQNKNGKKLQ
jgi:hypothetical protein